MPVAPRWTIGENGLKVATKGEEEHGGTVNRPLGQALEEEPEPPLPQAAAAARTGARTRADTARHLDLIVEPHFATPGVLGRVRKPSPTSRRRRTLPSADVTTQAGTAATGSQHCRVFTDAGTEPVKRQECGAAQFE